MKRYLAPSGLKTTLGDSTQQQRSCAAPSVAVRKQHPSMAIRKQHPLSSKRWGLHVLAGAPT
jgi:hypothetical protein